MEPHESAGGARARRTTVWPAWSARPAIRIATNPLTRVPGAPGWHPRSRSRWPGSGKSPAQICNQLKDPTRNGGKTLDQLVEHNTHDKLVAWGLGPPGADREPAPGTQEQFGALTAAWVQTGAACPTEKPMKLKINGVDKTLDVDPEMPLLWALRGHPRSHRHQVRLWRGAVRCVHPCTSTGTPCARA
jgi:hypothetical protein